MTATPPTARRKLEVRTPGAPTATPPTAEQMDEMAQESAEFEARLLGDAGAVHPEPADPGHAPDIKALIASEVRNGIAQALAAQARAQAAPAGSTASDLPDQSEINAFEIKREVLTKQGFVVPEKYPQPAGLPQSLR